jgi:DNA repair exonuclease SbcCD ATPase subunit
MNAINIEGEISVSNFSDDYNQDKTVLIKKIKAKINALEKRRERLKNLKKWSEAKESKYMLKVQKLTSNLDKLGEKSTKELNVDEIIKKLQKQLKFLNNARVNKNSKEIWTKKDDSIYEKKASVLIDSIIKLRMKKD